MAKMKNRKRGIIDKLPAPLKDTVEQMILNSSSYSYPDIVDYLKANEVSISAASVCRYARSYNGNLAMLNIAQENFRRMMEEMDKYPDLDTSEAIIRLTSQNIFNALANTDEDDWKNVSIDKMLKESTALIRAASYKKHLDIQNQSSMDTGLDAVKALVFETMAKERPELYKQVNEFLTAKKRDGTLKGGQ